MHRGAILFLLAAATLFAQARNTQPPDKVPVGALKVDGNTNYTAAQILSVAALRVGDLVSRRDFENARDRLMATGAFESVGYSLEPDTAKRINIATFHVAEVNPVFPIRFEDLPAPDAELVHVLQSRDPLFNAAKIPPVKPVLDRYSQWLAEFLASKPAAPGTKPVQVASEVASIGPGELAVLFRPAGSRLVVARVFFTGNKLISEKELQEAIWSVGVGTPWTDANFRTVLDKAIRPVYEARGHMHVSFPVLTAEPVNDVHGVKVTVTVDEGEAYSLGKVSITGNAPISPDELLSMGDFPTGREADFSKVNEGIERIRTALRHDGYLNAACSDARTLDDKNKVVDVVITIDAGVQYKMGKLKVKGLDLEAEAEIKRIWTLKEGSGYNPDYPDHFLKRVRDDGMFDNLGPTKADTDRNEKQHVVDVTLTFDGMDPSQKSLRPRGGRGGQL